MILHLLVGESSDGNRFVVSAMDEPQSRRDGYAIDEARREIEAEERIRAQAARWGWVCVSVPDVTLDLAFPVAQTVNGEVIDG